MTASLSACVIKFYLAESANKSGLWRLSMGSNWSVLQARSYFSEAFFHTAWISLDSGTRRMFLLEMWLPQQPSTITEGHIKWKRENHLEIQYSAGKQHWKMNMQVCAVSHSLRFHMDDDGDTQKQSMLLAAAEPISHTPRQQRECRP